MNISKPLKYTGQFLGRQLFTYVLFSLYGVITAHIFPVSLCVQISQNKLNITYYRAELYAT